MLIRPVYVLIQDLASVKGQIRDSNVDVQMEAVKGEDINETIEKIRQQYEKAVQKNREETEAWYQNKVRKCSASPDTGSFLNAPELYHQSFNDGHCSWRTK